MKKGCIYALLLASALFVPTSFANEKPPVKAKPLSEIIKMLENKGYSPITEVEIEGGRWEIEAYKGSEKREIKVDAITAEILSDRKDD